MGWEVGLIEVIAFIYFIGARPRFTCVHAMVNSQESSQGYAVDYSLHMAALPPNSSHRAVSTLQSAACKVYKYGSSDALADDDQIYLGANLLAFMPFKRT